MFFVDESQSDDAKLLAPHLRHSDLDELRAVTAEDPEAVIRESIEISSMCWTGWDAGQVVAIWGVAPILPGAVGGAWMLGTDDLLHMKRRVWELSVKHVGMMHQHYPVLLNWVDERNVMSRRWLVGLGFEALRRDAFHGIEQRPFLLYVSTRNV
jgi:hypothetical protein